MADPPPIVDAGVAFDIGGDIIELVAFVAVVEEDPKPVLAPVAPPKPPKPAPEAEDVGPPNVKPALEGAVVVEPNMGVAVAEVDAKPNAGVADDPNVGVVVLGALVEDPNMDVVAGAVEVELVPKSGADVELAVEPKSDGVDVVAALNAGEAVAEDVVALKVEEVDPKEMLGARDVVAAPNRGGAVVEAVVVAIAPKGDGVDADRVAPKRGADDAGAVEPPKVNEGTVDFLGSWMREKVKKSEFMHLPNYHNNRR